MKTLVVFSLFVLLGVLVYLSLVHAHIVLHLFS